MRVRVVHTLGDLEADLRSIPTRGKIAFAATVRRNANEGNQIARRLAKSKAGPHGKNYYKRLSAEMITPLSWEYGPEGVPKTEFVGVGFRSGVNLDLPNSADIIAPKFHRDIREDLDGLFW